MIVGVLTIEILIPACASLKEKRMVLNKIKDKSKKYNISIAETEYQDKWQRAGLAIATVSTAQNHVQEVLNKVFTLLDNDYAFEIIKYKFEYI